MFGSRIVMQPEARGNRMTAKLDVTKSNALGWSASKSVRDYIAQIVAGEPWGFNLKLEHACMRLCTLRIAPAEVDIKATSLDADPSNALLGA